MPLGRCPTYSVPAAIATGGLLLLFAGTSHLHKAFSPSSEDLPAPIAVPRSMEPVSTYADYLEILQINNTRCFPTEEPLSPTMKFQLGLGLMFGLLAKISETAFDLTATFSPIFNDVSKAVFVFTVFSCLACAGVFWYSVEKWIRPAWFVSCVAFPALVQALVSQLVDRMAQRIFGSNTTLTTAGQTDDCSEHVRRQEKLFKLTFMAFSRVLIECLLRYGDSLLDLPPTPQREYGFFIFKLSAHCFVPIYEYFQPSMQLSLAALAFLTLHDTIHWLHVCIFNSLSSPITTMAMDILWIPGLRVVIVVCAAIDYLINGDTGRPPAHPAYGRW
ncbi:hypothetical protein IWX47DRAFT_272253 [Phyllosticta citricarpa]|uniref:Uncharacterized protein n=1 Tax=Phyllosticta citricarpa TaxID=55181 RepID=A0ABR1MEC8_9PEZI